MAGPKTLLQQATNVAGQVADATREVIADPSGSAARVQDAVADGGINTLIDIIAGNSRTALETAQSNASELPELEAELAELREDNTEEREDIAADREELETELANGEITQKTFDKKSARQDRKETRIQESEAELEEEVESLRSMSNPAEVFAKDLEGQISWAGKAIPDNIKPLVAGVKPASEGGNAELNQTIYEFFANQHVVVFLKNSEYREAFTTYAQNQASQITSQLGLDIEALSQQATESASGITIDDSTRALGEKMTIALLQPFTEANAPIQPTIEGEGQNLAITDFKIQTANGEINYPEYAVQAAAKTVMGHYLPDSTELQGKLDSVFEKGVVQDAIGNPEVKEALVGTFNQFKVLANIKGAEDLNVEDLAAHEDSIKGILGAVGTDLLDTLESATNIKAENGRIIVSTENGNELDLTQGILTSGVFASLEQFLPEGDPLIAQLQNDPELVNSLVGAMERDPEGTVNYIQSMANTGDGSEMSTEDIVANLNDPAKREFLVGMIDKIGTDLGSGDTFKFEDMGNILQLIGDGEYLAATRSVAALGGVTIPTSLSLGAAWDSLKGMSQMEGGIGDLLRGFFKMMTNFLSPDGKLLGFDVGGFLEKYSVLNTAESTEKAEVSGVTDAGFTNAFREEFNRLSTTAPDLNVAERFKLSFQKADPLAAEEIRGLEAMGGLSEEAFNKFASNTPPDALADRLAEQALNLHNRMQENKTMQEISSGGSPLTLQAG